VYILSAVLHFTEIISKHYFIFRYILCEAWHMGILRIRIPIRKVQENQEGLDLSGILTNKLRTDSVVGMLAIFQSCI
jgi:hypothetical protein